MKNINSLADTSFVKQIEEKYWWNMQNEFLRPLWSIKLRPHLNVLSEIVGVFEDE